MYVAVSLTILLLRFVWNTCLSPASLSVTVFYVGQYLEVLDDVIATLKIDRLKCKKLKILIQRLLYPPLLKTEALRIRN